jgi:hypothetical protein
MTDQSSGTGPEEPVKEQLQPLDFQLISDDPESASYQALVELDPAPGSPVLAVTVTLASSLLHQAQKSVLDLLGGIKALFVLLPDPPPDSGGSGDDEPFDITKQLLIEIGLASSGGPGPVGVAVDMVTVTGVVPRPTGMNPLGGAGVEVDLANTVGANLEDYWRATSNQPLTATVIPVIGKGTIRNPTTQISVGHSGRLTAKEVIVTADANQALTYDMRGEFYLARHNVRKT